MPLSIILQQQEEAVDDVVENPPRGEHPVPEVEVERTPVPDSSPPATPPIASAPTNIAGPSYTAQQSLEHTHVSSKELAAVMDVVCTLATTQTSLDERMAQAKVTLSQNDVMLLQIMSHQGLPPVSEREPAQPTRDHSTGASSLDVLPAAVAASYPPTSTPPRE